MLIVLHATIVTGGTPEDKPVCWFYAIDNKSRDDEDSTRSTDPVVKEVREALIEVVKNDDRKIPGLDGTPTRYLDFKMPVKALHMLAFLRSRHGRTCSIDQLNDAAELFCFNEVQLQILMELFKNIGSVLYFSDVPDCGDVIVLEVQWLVDAISALIREEDLHGSLLKDLLADDPSKQTDAWHRTPTGVVWNEDDIQRGWFSIELLDFIWSHKTKYKELAAEELHLQFLKQVLPYFNLVHRVTREDGDFFVVPALVPPAPTFPSLPTLALLKNSVPMPEVPANVVWELSQKRKKHGQHVTVFDFVIDFQEGRYFPDDLFESLICSVANKVCPENGDGRDKPWIQFYCHEATFTINEHYIYAKKHPLHLQVYSINCGAGNYMTSQYSLGLFKKCLGKVVQSTVNYSVKLGHIDNGSYTYAPETDTDLAVSSVREVWYGESDLRKMPRRWKQQVNKCHL